MVEERVTLGVALEVEESSLIFLEPVRMSLARLSLPTSLGVLVTADFCRRELRRKIPCNEPLEALFSIFI
jgi:hypothetical protein